MDGFLTPRLREYIIKRDKILSNLENLKKERKNRLMNRCWQYDCRIRKRIDCLPTMINGLYADLSLLERWATEECHHDLIKKSVKHVSDLTHLIKTSHNSRKLPYSKFYRTTHLVEHPDGTKVMQETFSDGKRRIVGTGKIIANPEAIFRQMNPFRAWVEKQIEQKNSDELKRFAEYILTRLKEEK